jgi:hypothetical protein
LFSFHGGANLVPGLVKKILVSDVGPTEDEASALRSERSYGNHSRHSPP